MNTDMVNLGPPLRALPDQRSTSRRSNDAEADKAPGSFEQILSSKNENKMDKKAQGVTSDPSKKLAAAAQKEIKKGEDKDSEPDTKESVEAKVLGEKKEPALQPKLSERQKVMQKFMDSMESEFGIPPERVLEAIGQLSDQELLLSPEKTAPQVIAKLDLDPMESEKAEAMYLAMLTQLSGIHSQVKDIDPMPSETKAFVKNVIASGGMAAVLTARERRQMLNDSLDRMNSAFFVKPELRLPTEVVPDSGKEFMPDKLSIQNQVKPNIDLANAGLGGLKNDLKPKELDLKGTSVSAPRADSAPTEIQTEDLKEVLAGLGLTAAAVEEAIKADLQNAQALKMEKELRLQDTGKESIAAPVISTATPLAMALAKGKEFESGTNKDSSHRDKGLFSTTPQAEAKSEFVMPQILSPLKAAEATPPMGSLAGAGAVGGAVGAASARSGEDEVQANIQAIAKQAQYMIKKGGGEATVQMNPEGMGQVHLKVMLNEGKVNLEVKTENNETKKLIESSLGDLKTSLGVHRMAVDHVKVDVSNQLASNSDQRAPEQQNFKQDPHREQARQFFNQFHEDNLSRREGFYETSGVKAYSKNKAVEPLKPGDEARVAQTRRYQGAGKGSGLDLVA